MKNVLLLALLALLTGCYTQNKAVHQSTKAYSRFPDKVAELHELWFPDKLTDSTYAEYKPGTPIYRYDTVSADCDSITNLKQQHIAELERQLYELDEKTEIPTEQINNLKAEIRRLKAQPNTVYIPCPPCPERVDTLAIHRRTEIESGTLRTQLKQAQYLLQQSEIEKQEFAAKAGIYKRWAIGLGIATLILAVLAALSFFRR